MLKKSLIVLAVTAALLGVPSSVNADGDKKGEVKGAQVCVQVYGGGVVCGAEAPHKPVEAGLAENLALMGAGLMAASGVFFYLSKKARVAA